MFTIKIADIPICINNQYSFIYHRCEDFLVDEKPAITVAATKDLIDRNISSDVDREQAEYIAVLQLLVPSLIKYDAFLMHAAVIEVEKKGIAFAAASGVGKTTRVKMWQNAFGDNLKIINGDKPIIRIVNGAPYAYGTPWMGREHQGTNGAVPLNIVCFLERSEKVSLVKLSAQNAIPRLLHQVLLPREITQLDSYLPLIDQTLSSVSYFLLKCNKDKESVLDIWNQMKGEL